MSHVFFCMLFFILIPIVNVSSAIVNGNVTSPERKLGYDDLIDATVAITTCIPDAAQLTVLFGGQYDEFLRRAFINVVPVALVAANTRPRLNILQRFTLTKYSFIVYQSYRFVQFLRKAHPLVMIASSQTILRSVLQRTKDSPWANSDGFYILVDQRTVQRGCINARTYLWTAWDYDLLSVIFLCIDPNEGVVYYTFNPYSSTAPASWREVSRGKGRDGHPWILFKRKYVRDETLCKDLNFDKTLNLNQYHIRVSAVEMQPYVHIEPDKSGLDQYAGESGEILKIVFQKLNSRPEIYVRNITIYDIGGIGPNGTFEGMLGTLSDGRMDIILNPIPMYAYWKLRYTHPYMKTGLCAISQPYEMSMFARITIFMSLAVIIGILVVCVIIFIAFWKREGYGEAMLQLVRIMVGVGILLPPKINSARIFVCTVLIFFLNINALFQSQWSSLLTVPVFYSNTDSVEKLREGGYNLYGPPSLHDFVVDPVLKTRFYGVTYDACMEFVKNSSDAVCIEDCYHIHYRVCNENLYKSRMLREVPQSYATREDWPLYERVNHILRKMGEFGLIQKSRDESLFKYKLKSKWRDLKKKNYKPLSMKQLHFIFYLLASGYACAIVIFMTELVFRKRDTRLPNRKKIGKNENKERDVQRTGRQ